MRKLGIAIIAATTLGFALPAAAQVDFYAGPGGVGVGVGVPHERYYDYDPGYRRDWRSRDRDEWRERRHHEDRVIIVPR